MTAEQFMQQRAEFRQQILEAYGLTDMSPAEQAEFDAYGAMVAAMRADEEAFAAWITERFDAMEQRIATELAGPFTGLLGPLGIEPERG
jgi:DNA polymerase III delta subunit